MKPLLIILSILLTVFGLRAEAEKEKDSDPKQEVVTSDQLPPGIVKIMRMLRILKGVPTPEAVLEHLGIDKDKRVSKMDWGGELGGYWICYDLGINGEWVLSLSGSYSKGSDELIGPPKIFSVTLQKGSIRDFHEKGGDVDWKAILPYWQNGKMESELHYYGSDTILVQQEDTEQDGTGQPATRPESKSEGRDKPHPEAEGRSR